jgi:hypothetical protein
MTRTAYLDRFIESCKQEAPQGGGERFLGWETLVTVLVIEGLRLLLPELREWARLGATAIAMKRQHLRERLREYALEKELDFPAAERAAEVIAEEINEDNLERIIEELQG